MCRGELFNGEHLWNSAIGVPSKVVECDWCVVCSMPRPGYMDPKDKWKEGATDAAEEERAAPLQGLPADQQEASALRRPEVRDSLPGGEEKPGDRAA
jgi:hypothetical protein